jgi:hypothetical protein
MNYVIYCLARGDAPRTTPCLWTPNHTSYMVNCQSRKPYSPMSLTNRQPQMGLSINWPRRFSATTSSCTELGPMGAMMTPVSASCVTSGGGNSGTAAVSRMRSKVHVVDSLSFQHFPGARRQVGRSLDREDPPGQTSQHGRLVPAAGPDLQDLAPMMDTQLLRHQSHDIGLRDRLPFADRQRPVGVGAPAVRRGHKRLARKLRHDLQHRRIGDIAPAQVVLEHAFARCIEIVVVLGLHHGAHDVPQERPWQTNFTPGSPAMIESLTRFPVNDPARADLYKGRDLRLHAAGPWPETVFREGSSDSVGKDL